MRLRMLALKRYGTVEANKFEHGKRLVYVSCPLMVLWLILSDCAAFPDNTVMSFSQEDSFTHSPKPRIQSQSLGWYDVGSLIQMEAISR